MKTRLQRSKTLLLSFVTYTVLVTVKDEKTGEVTQREETISREAFEAAVKNGYLKKQ